jgi:hypothetical protein
VANGFSVHSTAKIAPNCALTWLNQKVSGKIFCQTLAARDRIQGSDTRFSSYKDEQVSIPKTGTDVLNAHHNSFFALPSSQDMLDSTNTSTDHHLSQRSSDAAPPYSALYWNWQVSSSDEANIMTPANSLQTSVSMAGSESPLFTFPTDASIIRESYQHQTQFSAKDLDYNCGELGVLSKSQIKDPKPANGHGCRSSVDDSDLFDQFLVALPDGGQIDVQAEDISDDGFNQTFWLDIGLPLADTVMQPEPVGPKILSQDSRIPSMSSKGQSRTGISASDYPHGNSATMFVWSLISIDKYTAD